MIAAMNQQKGFSLLELIVVLVMIAVVTGGVSIIVSGASSPEKQLNVVGKQLLAKMNFALDEALMQRRVIGLRIENADDQEKTSGYFWYRYENKQWFSLEEPLASVSIPENIIIAFSVDEATTKSLLENSLNVISDKSQEEKKLIPNIIFYPNSDISEFTLQLAFKDNEESNAIFYIFIDKYGQLAYEYNDSGAVDNTNSDILTGQLAQGLKR